MHQKAPVINAMTVDVEDYYHVSAFSDNVDRSTWGSYESRVERNTRALLDLFDMSGVKSTFFVLGWVAERLPGLIREIDAASHEVACHGYSHELVYNQTPDQFRQETLMSKNLLEDTIQKPVSGYRAASYSITKKSLWALDILYEAGFEYDSSIFPVRHDRYGMRYTPVLPYTLETESGAEITEFPLSTMNLFGYRLPVAGGGYFRIFPYWVTKTAINRRVRHNEPYIFYLHPWEIDPEQPRIEVGMLSRFRHYYNLDKTKKRLKRLINEYSFATVREVLNNLGDLPRQKIP